jgi:DeoR/GlpR family transcriptional regulator of sugar metabolism
MKLIGIEEHYQRRLVAKTLGEEFGLFEDTIRRDLRALAGDWWSLV